MDINIVKNETEKSANIELCGELDVQNASELKKELSSCAENCPNITIDCEKLEYIDSTGLGVLISSLKKARENGGGIALKKLKPFLKKLFVITAVDKLFDIEVEL